MNKFMKKLESFLSPIGEFMQKIKALNAIAGAMQAGMSIIIIGSFCTLFTNLDIGPWQSIVKSIPGFVNVCNKISSLTTGGFALFILILLTYMYAQIIGLKESVTSIPVAVAVFFILSPLSKDGNILANSIGMQSLITAIIIGLLVPRCMKFLIEKRIVIRMPDTVPQFVSEGFIILVPGLILCAIAGVIDAMFTTTTFGSFQNFIYTIIQTPLSGVGLSFGGFALIMGFASLILWPGLHANTIMGIVSPLLLAASAQNQAAIAAGKVATNIIEYQFNLVCDPGGQACLLIPCILGLLLCKSKQIKQVSKIAIVPAIFGIGEPILFGFPCMFNALFFIPMIVSTVFNVAFWFIMISAGLVGPFSGIILPWTTPPIINSFLASTTPLAAVFCHIVMLAIDVLIWLPFVRLYDKQLVDAEKLNEIESTNI